MKRILVAMFVILFAGANVWGVVGPADRQSLIDEGWIFSVEPQVAGGQLPDIVDEIVYSWAEDGRVVLYDRALYLGEGARARFRFTDQPSFGELSMLVYDKGASGPAPEVIDGPKWGVQVNPVPNDIPGPAAYDVVMGVELAWDGPGDGNLHYLFDPGAPADQPGILLHEGGVPYRRVNGNLPTNATAYDPANNVQGGWSKWTFTVHEGEDMRFTVSDPDGSNEQSWIIIPTLGSVFDTGFATVGMNQVFLYGGLTDGSGGTDHVGLWVNNITFTADVGQGVSDWYEGFDYAENRCHGIYCYTMYGDFNMDGQVGLLDLNILGQNWGMANAGPCQGDANGDWEVGLLDLDILGQYMGQAVPVPEPSGLMMFTVVAGFWIRRRL